MQVELKDHPVSAAWLMSSCKTFWQIDDVPIDLHTRVQSDLLLWPVFAVHPRYTFSGCVLSLSGARNIPPEIAHGNFLHTLNLKGCPQLLDVLALAGCAGCASLHTVDLSGCYKLVDVSGLAGCASLHTVDLRYCSKLVDVSGLAGCASLNILLDDDDY